MNLSPRPAFPSALLVAALLIPINFVIFLNMETTRMGWGPFLILFTLVAMAQGILAVVALVQAIRQRPRFTPVGFATRLTLGSLVAIGAPVGWLLGMAVRALAGGAAWGRPLRIAGRQIHADLAPGRAWTAGERPSGADLDPATATALAALWLHDAQKEHASVPAFARVSWLLVSAGAPADLVAWSHRAALEEIDHAQRCFALAEGYGGTSRSVAPMPELVRPDFTQVPSAVLALASEAISDGCQLEDFNADVAAASAKACTDPVTRRVLDQIAREERSHAAFSWAVLRWTLREHGGQVQAVVQRCAEELRNLPRPTATTPTTARLVALADADRLRDHGRLADAIWEELWQRRLALTTQRLQQLLAKPCREEAAA